MKKILTLTLMLLAFTLTVGAQSSERSFKRGFGENTLYYQADLKALAKGCSWFYNWGTTPASQVADIVGADNVCEFVPMAWTTNFSETELKTYYDAHTGDKYLLGFNEPNFKEQANIEPADAVEPWHRLEQFASANGLKLVAPALNYSAWTEYSTPDKWMDAFISAYKAQYGEAPHYDYLALHCYMDDPTAMLNFVETYAKKYGKQVWLTEFCAWESSSLTAAQQEKLMITKVEKLEKSQYVYRYAWFKARNSNSYPYYNLVEYPVKSKGIYAGTLTQLGFSYVNMPTFDTSKYYDVDERIPANQFIAQSGLESIRKSVDPRAIDSTEVYLHGASTSLTYQINVPTDGTYYLILRSSTETTSLKSRISVLDGSGNTLVSGHNLPNTDADTIYSADTSIELTLKAGKQQITIQKENAKASHVSLLKLVKAIDTTDQDTQTLKGTKTGSTTGGDTGGDDKKDDDNKDTGDTTTVDGVKITDAQTEPYTIDANSKYYAIYLDQTTASKIASDLYVNCGDNGTSQNSYVWENTYTYGDAAGENSFGVEGGYLSLVVADKGWSGMGYNVNAEKGDLDLSCINVDYKLHMALKSTSTESIDIYVTDGQNHTAHLVFGTKAMDGHSPVGNFKRDGKWHNVDISMEYLQKQYGLNFNKDTDYNGNLLCINCGTVEGTELSYDALFFYGPKDSTPDSDTKGFDITVVDIPEGSVSEFEFSKSDRFYGIYLDNETRAANIADNLYINCGDNGTTQNSYLWENTFTYGTSEGANSFGVEAAYKRLVVNSSSWTGMGYNVAAGSTPLNLSAISQDYTLHIAVRASHSEPIEFVLNDGQRDATIVLGQTAFDGHEALADFTRDGQWHEIYVPMKYLNSKFGTNFSTATNYTGNIFVVRTTAVVGNVVDYDAVFVYGPSSSKGTDTDTPDTREITITAAASEPYQFSADDDYYVIYLDSETQSTNLKSSQITDIGPDDVTRFLYTWSGTFSAVTASGNNSFGVPGAYQAWKVTDQGWSGLGYYIDAKGPVDLSGINSEYTLHFAVKSTSSETIEFYVVDGNGTTAYLPLGSASFEGHAPVGDFERDGEWYNVDVPVSYLVRQGLDYRTATAFTGNLFCLLAGGVSGTEVAYDAIFFHGPAKAEDGIRAIDSQEASPEGPIAVYNLQGARIASFSSASEISLSKGIYILRSNKGSRKVVIR